METSLKNEIKFCQILSIIHIFQQIHPEGPIILGQRVKILLVCICYK